MTQAAKHIKCNHSHHRTGFMVNDRQDPTRTLTLRNRYAREMKKRFRWLRGIIRDAVVEKDVFGIADADNRGVQSNLQIYAESGLGRQAFAFPRQGQKVSAFMEWLQRQVDRGILETRDRNRVGDSIDQTWQNIFLEDSYKRGVIRGNYELRQGGFPGVQTLDARGGINAVMGLPMHVDRLGVLYTRAFNDLKGITDAMDTQISRVLVQGLADGDGPRLIARKLSATVGGTSTQGLGITDTLGRFIPAERRAEILARTEVIRAHHHGMMQEYRNWGVEGVAVQAEFRTAGDDRVCPDCEALEGQVYTLDEAQNLIPVHPMCRCIALPARPGDRTSTDRTVGEEIEQEIEVVPEEILPNDIRRQLQEGTAEDGLERLVHLDDQGNRMDEIQIGDEASVAALMPTEARTPGAGITSIHTHPTLSPLSNGDIKTFARHEGLENMVVVMPNSRALAISRRSGVSGRAIEDRADDLFLSNYRNLVDRRSDGLITKSQMKRSIEEYQSEIIRILERENLVNVIDETGLIF